MYLVGNPDDRSPIYRREESPDTLLELGVQNPNTNQIEKLENEIISRRDDESVPEGTHRSSRLEHCPNSLRSIDFV